MTSTRRYLAAVVCAACLFFLPALASAGVNVSVGINLPAYAFHEPPRVVVIPGQYVYYAPDVDFDIFFYHGFWYRPWEGRWYRSTSYNGPWRFVAVGRVPGVLINIGPGYRHHHIEDNMYIPYDHLHRHWRTWERDRYWHNRHEYERDRWERHRDRERHDRLEHRREERHDRLEHRRDERRDRLENRREERRDLREKQQHEMKERQEHRGQREMKERRDAQKDGGNVRELHRNEPRRELGQPR